MISSFAISPTARVLFLHGNHFRLVGLKVHVHGFPDPEKNKASEIPFWETGANYFDGAECRTRTCTGLPMDPKSIASTNSANSACIDDIFAAVIVRTGLYKTFSLKVVRTFCVAWNGPHGTTKNLAEPRIEFTLSSALQIGFWRDFERKFRIFLLSAP